MIYPIDERVPACFGICCAERRECSRYDAVEWTSQDQTIATCDDGSGGRPLFLVREKEKTA